MSKERIHDSSQTRKVPLIHRTNGPRIEQLKEIQPHGAPLSWKHYYVIQIHFLEQISKFAFITPVLNGKVCFYTPMVPLHGIEVISIFAIFIHANLVHKIRFFFVFVLTQKGRKMLHDSKSASGPARSAAQSHPGQSSSYYIMFIELKTIYFLFYSPP